MDLNNLFLDFDEKIFTQSFLEEFNSKFSLLSNIQFSLKNAIKYYYSKVFNQDCDINFISFNAENITLKQVASKGFFIKNLKFQLLCNKKMNIDEEYNNEIIFKKGNNFKYVNDKYDETWIDARIHVYKRKEKTEIRVNICNIIIPKRFFEDLYKKKQLLCTNSCNENVLQEYPRNCWDVLVLFQCKICGKLYYCSCQEKAYNIIKEHYEKETNRGSFINNFLRLYSKSQKKDNICHICKLEPPKFQYCHTMYGSKFKSVYGSYILTEAINIADRYIDSENKDDKDYIKQADQLLRDKLDYPISGKRWVNENYLYNIVKTIFNEYRVEREYSPSWLNRKRIDIFVHELNLAIEYQGQQHYEAVDIFGGKEGLINTQKRDQEKYKLCKLHNIDLVYFKYDEELTEKSVISRLEKYIIYK